MAIEVKSKPDTRDVGIHVGHMKLIREYADRICDNRKYFGAIAGAIVADNVRNFAYKAGFYVLEQSGDTMKLDPPEGFTPREW